MIMLDHGKATKRLFTSTKFFPGAMPSITRCFKSPVTPFIIFIQAFCRLKLSNFPCPLQTLQNLPKYDAVSREIEFLNPREVSSIFGFQWRPCSCCGTCHSGFLKFNCLNQLFQLILLRRKLLNIIAINKKILKEKTAD